MLSDRERQELARIEEGLRAADRRFASGFEATPRIRPQHRWMPRALLGFGVFCLAVGVLTGSGMLGFQGVLLTGCAVLWLRWQAARAARAAVDGGVPPRPGARPDGPAPGLGRPF